METRDDRAMVSASSLHHPVVDRWLAGILAGDLPPDVYAPHATLDATVPGWRLQADGATAILDEYSRWFNGPGTFSALDRWPLPDGELVRYLLDFNVDGVLLVAHHAHILTISEEQIAREMVFCGGRWEPELVAQMGPAAHAG